MSVKPRKLHESAIGIIRPLLVGLTIGYRPDGALAESAVAMDSIGYINQHRVLRCTMPKWQKTKFPFDKTQDD